MNEKEMLEYFDCGWSGNDYHPPCDIKECSEYRNGKCLKSRSAIRALIIAVAEWKKRIEQLGDGIELAQDKELVDILCDIRDFGEEGK